MPINALALRTHANESSARWRRSSLSITKGLWGRLARTSAREVGVILTPMDPGAVGFLRLIRRTGVRWKLNPVRRTSQTVDQPRPLGTCVQSHSSVPGRYGRFHRRLTQYVDAHSKSKNQPLPKIRSQAFQIYFPPRNPVHPHHLANSPPHRSLQSPNTRLLNSTQEGLPSRRRSRAQPFFHFTAPKRIPMSTPAQAAASIANSKLSTGPSSDAGKQTVSSNALAHGLASSNPAHVALPGEEELLARHLESYRKAYAPGNQPEEDLVRTLAESYWRLERAHKLENALFSQILKQDDYKDLDPTVAKALAWSNKDTGLQRIALYAQRIQRTAEKTAAALKTIQQERKAAYNQAKEEAMYLTQLSLDKGNNFDPALHFGAPDLHGGFVYSRDEIKLALLRVSRLEEARARFKPAA
jgi:hypothetical protein